MSREQANRVLWARRWGSPSPSPAARTPTRRWRSVASARAELPEQNLKVKAEAERERTRWVCVAPTWWSSRPGRSTAWPGPRCCRPRPVSTALRGADAPAASRAAPRSGAATRRTIQCTSSGVLQRQPAVTAAITTSTLYTQQC